MNYVENDIICLKRDIILFVKKYKIRVDKQIFFDVSPFNNKGKKRLDGGIQLRKQKGRVVGCSWKMRQILGKFYIRNEQEKISHKSRYLKEFILRAEHQN